jgi:rhodanese-related sulfurtransferase
MTKFTKILLTSLVLVSSLFADFKTLSTAEVELAITKGVAIIDIRRDEEFKKYGIIKGSHRLTFFDKNGRYDSVKWMNEFTKIVTSKEQEFILVCAHANRTKAVAGFLDQKLKYKKVRDLKGGINYGWLDKGRKTIFVH